MQPCHVKTATLDPDENTYFLLRVNSVPKISALPSANWSESKKQHINGSYPCWYNILLIARIISDHLLHGNAAYISMSLQISQIQI